MALQLEVWQLDQHCVFKLSWGQGQRLSATLPYPESLAALYQEWQLNYFNFYRRLACDELTETLTAESELRGRVEESGSLSSTEDWRFKLVQAEASLLSEFHRWLNSAQLVEIRQQIALTARRQSEQTTPEPECHNYVDLFLTCSPLELERLPWEAWEIGTEFASTTTIRIARTPSNRQGETVQRPRRRRTRILAILGDDTGRNFQTDRQAVQSLSRIAEIEFMGWQPGQNVTELPMQIATAIEDEQGWDILFFAGHSNETSVGGGELAIAPHKSISIHEIARSLTIAKERGLQFAIFNSCSGLSIATSLIDLGIAQVAVMREPIHNRVAHEFLVPFLQALAGFKDVHDALLSACEFLKSKRSYKYPSVYLVPSLFRHPGAVLFRINPVGLKERLKQWLPTRQQAIALGSLLLLSLLPPVQNLLLEPRVWMQAVYRNLTGQVPPAATPPVLLVQIDEESIRKSGISNPRAMDRDYLASLVNQLAELDAKVVGIDYLLDRQQPEKDQVLAQAIRNAVKQKHIWFVFGSILDDMKEVGVGAETGIASPNWSLQGYTYFYPSYVELLAANDDCYQTCPFSYLLSLAKTLNSDSLSHLPQPQLDSQSSFRNQVLDSINHSSIQNPEIAFLRQLHLSPITGFSKNFEQLWLQPILDFSIPSDRIYNRIAAWQLLGNSLETSKLKRLHQQVVIVGAGGYVEAGVTKEGEDTYSVPFAVKYWNKQSSKFTGAELHAYTIHHLLTQRLVVSIPDLWMVGVAVLLGKGTALVVKQQQQQQHWKKSLKSRYLIGLVSATAIYGLAGLQIYLSAAVLLPWSLPSAAFWIYVLPALKKKPHV